MLRPPGHCCRHHWIWFYQCQNRGLIPSRGPRTGIQALMAQWAGGFWKSFPFPSIINLLLWLMSFQCFKMQISWIFLSDRPIQKPLEWMHRGHIEQTEELGHLFLCLKRKGFLWPKQENWTNNLLMGIQWESFLFSNLHQAQPSMLRDSRIWI